MGSLRENAPVPALVDVSVEPSRKIDIMPAEVVEGMLAEHLSETKSSLDIWHAGLLDDAEASAKATLSITWHHLSTCLALLDPYSDAALRPKHRAVRAVLREMRSRLLRNNHGLDTFSLDVFAKDMVEYMTAYHLCLSESTDVVGRKAAKEAFCATPEEGDVHA